MNESDKLFMETAEKQQEIIDALLEACNSIIDDAKQSNVYNDILLQELQDAVDTAKGG
ncbi:hypothetical protein LCGC14_2172090 [marine sediment metagenome]|uniref:Uncharacterized protein n=1 Tax=marine sediment metagenome TaxID=412755 RepID=A0A0F9G2E7_9ZZZZ